MARRRASKRSKKSKKPTQTPTPAPAQVGVEKKIEKPVRRSTGGMVLGDLPRVPKVKQGEKLDPLEIARGLDTKNPPRRTYGPHGPAPKGLSEQERRIWFHEGPGSIDGEFGENFEGKRVWYPARTGVRWAREYDRRLQNEHQRENEDRNNRSGQIDETETFKSGRPLPWGIHGVFVKNAFGAKGPNGDVPQPIRVMKSADGKMVERRVPRMRDDIGRSNIPASKQA